MDLEVMILYSIMMEMKYVQLNFTTRVKKIVKLFKGWQVSKIVFNYFDYYFYYMTSSMSVLKGQK